MDIELSSLLVPEGNYSWLLMIFHFVGRTNIRRKLITLASNIKFLGSYFFTSFFAKRMITFLIIFRLHSFRKSVILNRCLARARLVHANNKVEFQNLKHNHPLIFGRRPVGEVQKLKEALKKKRRKELKMKSHSSSEESE